MLFNKLSVTIHHSSSPPLSFVGNKRAGGIFGEAVGRVKDEENTRLSSRVTRPRADLPPADTESTTMSPNGRGIIMVHKNLIYTTV